MPSFHLATLRLTCDRRQPQVTTAFAQRWPMRLQRAWRSLTFRPDTDLEKALNARILADCAAPIAGDLGSPPMRVEALRAGEWVVAPEGGYVQSAVIHVISPLGLEPWVFQAGGGLEASISVYATFDLIEYTI